MIMKKILILLVCTCLVGYQLQAQRAYYQKERGFVYMTSVGYATGLGRIELENKTVLNKNFNVPVNQLLAYQFNNFFYMGLTAGFDFWRHTAFIPIGLSLNVNMMETRIAPILYLNGGYSFKWYVSTKPENMDRVVHGTTAGPYGDGGLGVRIKLNDKLTMLISACYKVQYSDIRYTIPVEGEPDNSAYTTNSRKNVLYHFVGARLGLKY